MYLNILLLFNLNFSKNFLKITFIESLKPRGYYRNNMMSRREK